MKPGHRSRGRGTDGMGYARLARFRVGLQALPRPAESRAQTTGCTIEAGTENVIRLGSKHKSAALIVLKPKSAPSVDQRRSVFLVRGAACPV